MSAQDIEERRPGGTVRRSNAKITDLKLIPARARDAQRLVLVLRRARELIENPAHWVRGWYNFDTSGVDQGKPSAFSVEGAIEHAARELLPPRPGRRFWTDCARRYRLEAKACDLVMRCSGAWPIWGNRICVWNDHLSTNHADVLAALDRSLLMAGGKIGFGKVH